MLVTLATMLCIPLLLKILPTLVNKESHIPMKLLNLIFIVGKFFNKLMNSPDGDNRFNKLLKERSPKFFVNLMIVIAILAIIDYFNDGIVNLITQIGIPLAIEPEILLSIVSILLIIYLVIAMIGKIEKLVTNMSDILSTKLIPADTKKLEEKSLHRLLQNIFFTWFILVLIAVIQPYIEDMEFFPFLPFIISGIGLAVVILLVADSVFVFQKLSHEHIMDSLMKDDENSEYK